MDVKFSYVTTRTITMTDEDIEILADGVLDYISDYVEKEILEDDESFSALPYSIKQAIVNTVCHRIKSYFTE